MWLADFFHPHNPTLVIVSLAVAVFAAYVSCDLAGQIRISHGWARAAWLAAGAVALGGGIWSMHFIAMLALILPVPVRYDVPLTVLSFVIPIPPAALGLYIVHSREKSWPRTLLGGAVVGGGISAMHYTGMAAIDMPAIASYVPALVILSVAIATAASTAALWLAASTQTAIIRLCGSSLGIAISGLHYSGVAAFICTPTRNASLAETGLSPSGLAPWVSVVSLVLLWNILIFGAYDRRLLARRLVAEHRLDLLTVLRNAQEEERLRIARELHDQLGQDLIGLSLMLKSLEPRVQTEQARETVRQLESLTADMERRVHDIAVELRPSLPGPGGLRSALENYVSDWSGRFKIAVDFRWDDLDGDDLPTLVEATIFRVVQEAFTNILKHAAAANVRLLVERQADRVRIVIEDDGKGLDHNAAAVPNQLGLIGIRERLALIDGTLSIEAASPSGTILTITAPLARSARGTS
jgi:NO-binding membrane sensor protein with MHYT domain/two-component sensor histidine kinase